MTEDQLQWEAECIRRGEQRYFDEQDKIRAQKDELTDASKFVLQDRLRLIADILKADCKAGAVGKNAAYNKIVRQLAGDNEDYLRVGYIGLKYLLVKVGQGKRVGVTNFVSKLGSRFEHEFKCTMFQAKYPEYYATVQKSFLSQGVTSVEHMQKVMSKKFADFELDWNEWTINVKVQVGMRVLRSILQGMDDLFFVSKTFERGKTSVTIDTSNEFDDWIAEFERERGLLLPLLLPLKCPPRPWGDQDRGAYYTPRLQIPFIKVRGSDAREFVSQHKAKQHRTAVNKMQRTAWRINRRVLEVQDEVFRRDLGIGVPVRSSVEATPFPAHLKDVDKLDLTESQKTEVSAWKQLRKAQYEEDRKRKGRVLGFRQGFLLAKELADWDKFFFAYNCDFRGRIYCATSGLSPQGADHAKGLLQFAKGVRLGKSGIKWLAVQGANTYGEDKISYDDRVKWVREREAEIRAIVEDPIANTQWADADKPYQFLAFCFEWADSDYGRNPEAIGHIPVGLDGSCNGLQHFSAMLRDGVGAKATNLRESELQADIYGEVAKVTIQKLRQSTDPMAKVWLSVGVNRKCAKRPVMTLPYGATQQSARQYIFEYVVDNWHKFGMEKSMQWEVAKFLTPIMWEAIGEVVVAARAAMSWLQSNIPDGYCSWTTVIGFPVYQHYVRDNLVCIRTQLNGTLQLWAPTDNKGIAYRAQQRNGIAPNFVHSIDSTHMVLTINMTDFHSYAMIHDDFGTHAGNTDILFKSIRKSFWYLYSNTDPLEHWAKQVGADSSELHRGSYKISEIHNAQYFFG